MEAGYDWNWLFLGLEYNFAMGAKTFRYVRTQMVLRRWAPCRFDSVHCDVVMHESRCDDFNNHVVGLHGIVYIDNRLDLLDGVVS